MIKSFFLFFLLTSTPLIGFSYIPRVSTVLEKTTSNNGTGVYQIEQEVIFSAGTGEPLVIKETWLVENDSNMRLIVTAGRELKDRLKWVIDYNSGARAMITPQGRVAKKTSPDFIEKWFHFRKPESLGNAIEASGILPSSSINRRIQRSGKDFIYPTDENVRLARIGGTVSYAYGKPSPIEGSPFAGLWIEQDMFVIRKIRLPSGAEVSADNYSAFSKGLNFPLNRTVRWENNAIQIQTLSVSNTSVKSINSPLETSQLIELPSDLPEKLIIDEFYLRFR